MIRFTAFTVHFWDYYWERVEGTRKGCRDDSGKGRGWGLDMGRKEEQTVQGVGG